MFGLKGTYRSDAKQNDDGTYEMDLDYVGPELQMFTEEDGRIGFTDAGWVQVSLTKLGGPLDKDPKNYAIDPIYCTGEEFVMLNAAKGKYGWENDPYNKTGLEKFTTAEFIAKLLANPKIYQDWADKNTKGLSRVEAKKKIAESDALANTLESSFLKKFTWRGKNVASLNAIALRGPSKNEWIDYNTVRNKGKLSDGGELYYMSKHLKKYAKTPHRIDVTPYIKKMQASQRLYINTKEWIKDDSLEHLRTGIMDMVHSPHVSWKWLRALQKAFGVKQTVEVGPPMWNPECDEEFVLNQTLEKGQLCYVNHDNTIELTEFGHPKENVSDNFETQCYSYISEDVKNSKTFKVENIDQFEESFYVALPSDAETEYKIEGIDRKNNTISVSLGHDGENYKLFTASKDDRVDIVAKSNMMGDKAELEKADCAVIDEEEPPVVTEEETTPTPTPTPTWGSPNSASACCSEVTEEIVGTGSHPDTIHEVRKIKVKDPCHFKVGHYVAIEGIEQLALVTGKSSSKEVEYSSYHDAVSDSTPTPENPEEENYLIIGSGPAIGGSAYFDKTISVGAKICVVTLEENTCSDCYYNSAVKWTEDMWDAEHLQKDAYRLSDMGGEDCTCREEIYSTDCSEGRIPWDVDGEKCLNNGYCWAQWDPAATYEGEHLCPDEEEIKRAEQEGIIYKTEPFTKCTDYVCHNGFVWKAIVDRPFSGVEPTSEISKDVKHPSYWAKVPSMCCGAFNPEPTPVPISDPRDSFGACCFQEKIRGGSGFSIKQCLNKTQSQCDNLGGSWYMGKSCFEVAKYCWDKKEPPPDDPWDDDDDTKMRPVNLRYSYKFNLNEVPESRLINRRAYPGNIPGKAQMFYVGFRTAKQACMSHKDYLTILWFYGLWIKDQYNLSIIENELGASPDSGSPEYDAWEAKFLKLHHDETWNNQILSQFHILPRRLNWGNVFGKDQVLMMPPVLDPGPQRQFLLDVMIADYFVDPPKGYDIDEWSSDGWYQHGDLGWISWVNRAFGGSQARERPGFPPGGFRLKALWRGGSFGVHGWTNKLGDHSIVSHIAPQLAGDYHEQIVYYDDSDGKGPEGKRLYENPNDEVPIVLALDSEIYYSPHAVGAPSQFRRAKAFSHVFGSDEVRESYNTSGPQPGSLLTRMKKGLSIPKDQVAMHSDWGAPVVGVVDRIFMMMGDETEPGGSIPDKDRNDQPDNAGVDLIPLKYEGNWYGIGGKWGVKGSEKSIVVQSKVLNTRGKEIGYDRFDEEGKSTIAERGVRRFTTRDNTVLGTSDEAVEA